MDLISGTFAPDNPHPTLRAVRDINGLSMEHGPWVAGGAVRRILTGEEVGGDVDLFLPNLSPYKYHLVDDEILFAQADHRRRQARNLYVSQKPYFDHRTKGGHTIQVILFRTFASPSAILDTFDFTVAMAVTDGRRWFAHPDFLKDCEQRVLRVPETQKPRQNLTRLEKYLTMGFTPAPGVLSQFLGLDGNLDEVFAPSGHCLPKDEDYNEWR